MGAIWKEIMPNDRFCVQVVRSVSMAETRYLTHLYQPLVGPVAISLYQTLYAELPSDSLASSMGTHRWLMSLFMMPLDQIVEARQKLEAIGLIRTVKYEGNNVPRLFEYTLHPPLTPYKFFADELLSVMLLNRIGKNRFEQLRQKFSIRDCQEEKEKEKLYKMQDMTKSFEEVFHFLSSSELDIQPGSESDIFMKSVSDQLPLPYLDESMDEQAVTLQKVDIDFDYLQAVLPKWVNADCLKDHEVKDFIKKMSYLYSLDNEMLARLLQEPVVYNDQDILDLKNLKKVVKVWYREQSGDEYPVLVEKGVSTDSSFNKQNESLKEKLSPNPSHQKMDMYQEHIHRLQTTPPLTLLREYQGGGKVSSADQKIVEELLEDYLLPPGVVNVLLEYVMITQDKQLPKALIFKIAAHWKRASIKTVAEAQQQAKQLYQKHLDKENSNFPNTKRPGRKAKGTIKKEDILPEWVKEQLEKEKASPQKSSNHIESRSGESLDEKQKRIAALLKELRK